MTEIFYIIDLEENKRKKNSKKVKWEKKTEETKLIFNKGKCIVILVYKN